MGKKKERKTQQSPSNKEKIMKKKKKGEKREKNEKIKKTQKKMQKKKWGLELELRSLYNHLNLGLEAQLLPKHCLLFFFMKLKP
jgi:hypothetical protein